MRTSDADTIVAIATAPGEGAIGIVRVSGPSAVEIAGGFFRGGRELHNVEDRRLAYGRFVIRDQDLDEVLVSVMRGPCTYTGEDIVEFNCHGGPLLLRCAVDALVEAGCRRAERGEFTRRAFLNGRMDLTQAEAVAEMIASRSDLGLRSAYFQLRGGLRRRFETIGEDLRQALVLLEAGLDFSEDVYADARGVRSLLGRVGSEVDGLVASYGQGKVIREGCVVTLAGRPNVGKSSLLNRLLEEERAIVTPVPGTTRDTIEESVDLDGIAVTLVDTAGIRGTDDPIEVEGTRRARRSIARSQLVLLVVDGSVRPEQEDVALLEDAMPREGILVLNKVDLGRVRSWGRIGPEWPHVATCALDGSGLDVLRREIRSAALGGDAPLAEAVTRERHVEALKRCRRRVADAREAMASGLPWELVALEVKEALGSIGEVVGETTSDEVLGRIFEAFCVGK